VSSAVAACPDGPPTEPFYDTRVKVHTIVAAVSEASAGPPGRGALSGVRILDFTRLGFGAQATLICGCLGAEVIRVESTTRPDPIRVMPPFVPDPGEHTIGFGSATLSDTSGAPSANRGGVFYKYNTGGKKSITVDASHPRGLALLKDLVAESDVVTESFAAGTLERWGLGYQLMRERRPDVIYVSMCGFGHEGPDSAHVTMGPTAQALTGLTFLVGLPDRPPAGWTFSYLDHVGGYLGAVAILTGLLHRARTGEGQYIDVSQLEPATALSGAIFLDALVNHRPARRAGFPTGNRREHPPTSPGGAYRTAADVGDPDDKWADDRWPSDNWIVISCRTNQQWDALVKVMGQPDWCKDPRFSTLEARVANEDELDRLIEHWTITKERYQTMAMLQVAGVPAGVVQDAADRLDRDPQLRARGHFTLLGNAEVAPMPLEGVPFKMSATPPDTGGAIHRGPPLLGEDTEAVLTGILGMSYDAVNALAEMGVLR
jgi:crotonobetainyl-CoA:carnitine CoA-transferase CaiB-like acyl-CoA transferase